MLQQRRGESLSSSFAAGPPSCPLLPGTSAVHDSGSGRHSHQALHVRLQAPYRKASPPSPACSVADSSTPAIERRPPQALHVRLQAPHRKASPPSPACLLQTHPLRLSRGVPGKPCMSIADSSTPAIERRPRQALHVCCRLIHSGYREASPPSPACLLQTVSVLRSCTLGPYVPLRRTPSESVSAIGHAGLRCRDAFSEPPCLQSDMQGLGAGTPSLSLRAGNWTQGLGAGTQSLSRCQSKTPPEFSGALMLLCYRLSD